MDAWYPLTGHPVQVAAATLPDSGHVRLLGVRRSLMHGSADYTSVVKARLDLGLATFSSYNLS